MKKMVGYIFLFLLFSIIKNKTADALQTIPSQYVIKGIYIDNRTKNYVVNIDIQEAYLHNTLSIGRVDNQDAKQFMGYICAIEGIRVTIHEKNGTFFSCLGYGTLNFDSKIAQELLEYFKKINIYNGRDLSIIIDENIEENSITITIKNCSNGQVLTYKNNKNNLKQENFSSDVKDKKIILV